MAGDGLISAVRRAVGNAPADMSFALRMFRKSPAVTIVTVLPLAVAIGANTAIFSLVNALFLRPLPVRAPEGLVFVTDRAAPGIRSWSYPIWDQLRRHAGIFQGAFAWSPARFSLSSGAKSEFVQGVWIAGAFFDTLGIRPTLGRGISPSDDERGGGPDGPVVVISHRFWQRALGGASDAIGRRINLEHVPFTIVGVAPPEFVGIDVGQAFDVLVPFGAEPLMRGKETELDRQCCLGVTIMARLKPGQSVEAAATALQSVQPEIREASLPFKEHWRASDLEQYLKNPFVLESGARGHSALRLQYERPLFILMCASIVMLLIACANVANLLLARAAERRYELDIRRALGATPGRLVQQLFTESALLASFSTAIGVMMSYWADGSLIRQLSAHIELLFLDTSMDWRVFAFGIVVTATTTVMFGTAPAFLAAKASTYRLHAPGRGLAGRRFGHAGALVVIQVALSFVLIVGAGLFVRTLWSLTALPLGFDFRRVLLVSVTADRAKVPPQQLALLFGRAVESVRAVPGVANAALSFVTPVSGVTFLRPVGMPGLERVPESERVSAINLVSPRWFNTLGIRLMAGRDFTERDVAAAPAVVIVNQAFEKKYLKDRSLGRTVGIGIVGPTPGSAEVIGVVADAVNRSLRESIPPTMYFPLAQVRRSSFASLTLNVRSQKGTPTDLIRAVADAITRVAPELTATFRLLSDQLNAALTRERVVALLSAFFGTVSLGLSGIGLFGLTAYSVSRRRREMAIRVALGATPAIIERLVLGGVARLIVLGLLIGVVTSYWVSQSVSALLYGLEPHDPATFAGAAVLLTSVGAGAGWFMARNAARTSPAEILKQTP